ncbi:MAG TPA: hypothetical protein VEX15_08605 [Nocardioidaceae bacterium]|nr:hypothetical protein [Nocardioidaceae bacterium]
MTRIHVEFQEGWTGDRVEVRIQRALRYAGQPITRLQTGYAGGLTVDVEGGVIALDVRVPSRSAGASRTVRVTGEHWIGVSLLDTKVTIVDQPAPFGYL